jgi:hypothetical protein
METHLAITNGVFATDCRRIAFATLAADSAEFHTRKSEI